MKDTVFQDGKEQGVKKPSFPFTSIQIIEDRNVTAIFEINSHQLTILSAEEAHLQGQVFTIGIVKLPFLPLPRMVMSSHIGKEMTLPTPTHLQRKLLFQRM